MPDKYTPEYWQEQAQKVDRTIERVREVYPIIGQRAGQSSTPVLDYAQESQPQDPKATADALANKYFGDFIGRVRKEQQVIQPQMDTLPKLQEKTPEEVRKQEWDSAMSRNNPMELMNMWDEDNRAEAAAKQEPAEDKSKTRQRDKFRSYADSLVDSIKAEDARRKAERERPMREAINRNNPQEIMALTEQENLAEAENPQPSIQELVELPKKQAEERNRTAAMQELADSMPRSLRFDRDPMAVVNSDLQRRGIPTNPVNVPTDDEYKANIAALDKAIEDARNAGSNAYDELMSLYDDIDAGVATLAPEELPGIQKRIAELQTYLRDGGNETEVAKAEAEKRAYEEYVRQLKDSSTMRDDLEDIFKLSPEDSRMLIELGPNFGLNVKRPLRDYEKQFLERTGLTPQRTRELAETMTRVSNLIDMQNSMEAKGLATQQRPILQNIVARGENLIAGPMGTLETATQGLDRLFRGSRYENFDLNAPGYKPGKDVQQVSQTTSDMIGSDMGKFFYQAGTSLADNAARLITSSAVLGPMGGAAAASAGSLALSATQSFSNTFQEVQRNGGTPQQALLKATVDAGIEALTEKIGLDNLLKAPDGPGFWNAIRRAAASVGAEISEEELSLIGQTLSDAAIMRNSSEGQKLIDEMVMSGTSLEDAKAAVLDQFMNKIIETAATTAVTSLGMNAGMAGYRTVMNRLNNASLSRLQEDALPETAIDTALNQGQAETAEASPAAEPAPQSALDIARQSLEATGKLSSNTIDSIIADGESLQQLMEQRPDLAWDAASSKSQMRTLVREAMAAPVSDVSADTTTDTATQQETAPAPAPSLQDSLNDTLSQTIQENNPEAVQQEAPMQEAPVPQQEQTAPVQQEQQEIQQPQENAQPQETAPIPQENTGAPSRDLDMSEDDIAELARNRADSGAQRDRFGQVRSPEVTNRDSNNNPVSESAGNLQSSIVTSDAMVKAINKLQVNGELSEGRQSNAQSVAMARESIAKDGTIEAAMSAISKVADSGRGGAVDVAKAGILYEYFNDQMETSEKGSADYERAKQNAADTFVNLTKLSRNVARGTQIFSMFQRMNPEVQKSIIKREVQNEVARLIKRGRVKPADVDFNNNLMQNYADACTQLRKAGDDNGKVETARKAVAAAQDAIYKDVATQLHTTLKAQWDSWRYLSMLGNVKTQVRNLAGNAAMKPYYSVKRSLNNIAQSLILDQQDRTTTFMGFSKDSRAMIDWARNDAKSMDVEGALRGSAKIGDAPKGSVEENLKTFDFRGHADALEKGVNAYNKATSWAVEQGDMVFKNREYTNSLARFLKARGVDSTQLQTGDVDQALLNEARAYAVNEAKKATFNDQNAFSDAVSHFLRYPDAENVYEKAANILGESFMPFRKTPANILVRSVEFSPVGLANGVKDAVLNIRNGKKTAAQVIDEISSGLTGTGSLLFGYALADGLLGVKLVGGNRDEDEKRRGHQNYSLEATIGGQTYSYTIDWAAPSNLPLFVGASLYDLMNNSDKYTDVDTFSKIVMAGKDMIDPMLELSCLSSIKDFKETMSSDDWTVAMAQIATNYLTQGIPTLVKQAHTAAQENKTETFANANNTIVRALQRSAAGVPFVGDALGLRKERVNNWGETESDGEWWERAIKAGISPGTLKTVNTDDPLEDEIARLNRVQPDSVSPSTPSKSLTYTDKNGQTHKDYRLTVEQYDKLEREQGSVAREVMDDILADDRYSGLPDDAKASAMNLAKSYAREMGLREAIDDYETAAAQWIQRMGKDDDPVDVILEKVQKETSGYGSMDTYNDAVDAGFTYKQMQPMSDVDKAFTKAIDGMRDQWKKGNQSYVDMDSVEAAYAAYEKLDQKQKDFVMEHADGFQRDFILAKQAGADTDKFFKLYKQQKLDEMNKVSDKGEDYQKVYNDSQAGIYSRLMDSDGFSDLTEADQIAAMKKAKTKAAAMAEKATSGEEPAEWEEPEDFDSVSADIVKEVRMSHAGYSGEKFDDAESAGYSIDEMKAMSSAEKGMSKVFTDMQNAWKAGSVFTNPEGTEKAYAEFQKLPAGQQKFIEEHSTGFQKQFLLAKKANVGTQQFLDLYRQYKAVNTTDQGASYKDAQWQAILDTAVKNGKITRMQREKLHDNMGFTVSMRVENKNYQKVYSATSNAEYSSKVARRLTELEPEDGKTTVSDWQKFEAVQQLGGTKKQQEDTILSLMTDSQKKRYNSFKKANYNMKEYIALYKAKLTAPSGKKADQMAAYKKALKGLGLDQNLATQVYKLFN